MNKIQEANWAREKRDMLQTLRKKSEEYQAKMAGWRPVEPKDGFPAMLPMEMPNGTRYLFGTETDGQGRFRVKNPEDFKRLSDLGGR